MLCTEGVDSTRNQELQRDSDRFSLAQSVGTQPCRHLILDFCLVQKGLEHST